jgi:hypothetical protein
MELELSHEHDNVRGGPQQCRDTGQVTEIAEQRFRFTSPKPRCRLIYNKTPSARPDYCSSIAVHKRWPFWYLGR